MYGIGCFRRSAVLFASALLAISWLPLRSTAAADLITIHTFTAPDQPNAGLLMDASGALDGAGRNAQFGTIFKLTPPAAGQTAWAETILYNFAGGTDGYYPAGSLILDASGALYGTTADGGSSDFGTVFKLTPPAAASAPWTKTVLYSFVGGGSDGVFPHGSLVFDALGALYGTDYSTAFKLKPPAEPNTAWSIAALHSFPSSQRDGFGVGPSLIIDASGALYGMTEGGGSFGKGTIFKLSPPTIVGLAWTETILHSFAGGSDGCNACTADSASSLIMDASGTLYGMTVGGGKFNYGTVFELTPPGKNETVWTETVLHAFGAGRNRDDGKNPYSGLVMGSADVLFGVTQDGGKSGLGAAFSLKVPAAGETVRRDHVLHSFGIGTGGNLPLAHPDGNLIMDPSGALYGVTYGQGASSTVFKLVP